MRYGIRPFYQSIPEIYLVLSLVFSIVWLLSFFIPLPVDLNPDGVLRVLVVMAISFLMLLWGLFGMILCWLRMPLLELAGTLMACPIFGVAVWGAEITDLIMGVSAYCMIFLWVWIISVLRIFKPIE